MTLYSWQYRDLPRIKPADYPPPVDVSAVPGRSDTMIGRAFPVGRVGGCRPGDTLASDYPPAEVTWRIELDHRWVGGTVERLEENEDLGDRWVLRRGVFVELAEDAT